MSKKLIIVDLDNTLLDSPTQKLPTNAFAQIVQDIQSDYLVGCATGRAYSWALPVLKTAHFTAPCIVGGGTMIIDQNNYSSIKEKPLPTDQLDAIKNILTKYPHKKLLFNDYTDSDYVSGGWDLSKLLNSNECILIDALEYTNKEADDLVSMFNQLPQVTAVKMNGYHQGAVDVLISHSDATKTKTIQNVQTMLGITKNNTIGIGNGYNDMQIFDAVGTKVAVKNAVESLKLAADIIIDDVTYDPVTSFIRDLYKN